MFDGTRGKRICNRNNPELTSEVFIRCFRRKQNISADARLQFATKIPQILLDVTVDTSLRQ